MAAVDEWNKDVCTKLPPDYINTGVFFTRPHELILTELVHTKENDTEWPCRYANQASYAALEFGRMMYVQRTQDVVNRVVLGIHKGVGFDCLDDWYNCMLFSKFERKCTVNIASDPGNAVFHYAAGTKPWHMNNRTCYSCGCLRCLPFCRWVEWRTRHPSVLAAIAIIDMGGAPN